VSLTNYIYDSQLVTALAEYYIAILARKTYIYSYNSYSYDYHAAACQSCR